MFLPYTHTQAFCWHAENATATAASAAPVLAAPPSPDVTVCTADGATAAAASTTGTGMDVDTDPALGAAAIADTTDGKSRGRKRDGALINGPDDGDVAGGSVAMAADATAGDSAVDTYCTTNDIPPLGDTVEDATDDTHAPAVTDGMIAVHIAGAPQPARSPSPKRPRNNRNRRHSHVGRAARRATLHPGQAGHCSYDTHPDAQCDTTDA